MLVQHLAHMNIAPLRYPPGHPRVAEFIDNIDKVNALAARMPGFVWRFDDRGDASLARKLFGDPSMTFTISIWETPEALRHFVWNTIHKRFFDKRAQWFRSAKSANMVLWWIDAGTRPTPEMAVERLDHLVRYGNSEFAFDWSFLNDAKLSSTRRYG
ncbi:MAG: DUF3291 domain-containing protein [Pseudomonadota bacterium]